MRADFGEKKFTWKNLVTLWYTTLQRNRYMIIPSGHSKAMRQCVSEQSGHALEEIRHEMESQLLKHFSDVRVNQEMGLRFTTSTEKESFLNLTSPI